MRLVINKRFGGFGLSIEALYKCVKENSPLVTQYHYGEPGFTNDWAKFEKEEAIEDYKEYKTSHWHRFLYDAENKILYTFNKHEWNRSEPELIALVEEMGAEANGDYAELKIVEIPDDVEFYISDYDGVETIREKHRSWS